jgi:hypothetical protein
MYRLQSATMRWMTRSSSSAVALQFQQSVASRGHDAELRVVPVTTAETAFHAETPPDPRDTATGIGMRFFRRVWDGSPVVETTPTISLPDINTLCDALAPPSFAQ